MDKPKLYDSSGKLGIKLIGWSYIEGGRIALEFESAQIQSLDSNCQYIFKTWKEIYQTVRS